MSGVLIAVEGIDGSGKSTLIDRLLDSLGKAGLAADVVRTREPWQEAAFAAVTETYDLDPFGPAYMFFFQMLHTLKAERATAMLQQNMVVIADRWEPSFFIWHENFGFFASKLGSIRDEINKLAFREIKPDLGIFIDVDVRTAIQRRLGRGERIADPEAEIQMYDTVATAYRQHMTRQQWMTVDANRDSTEVFNDVWHAVKRTVNSRLLPTDPNMRHSAGFGPKKDDLGGFSVSRL